MAVFAIVLYPVAFAVAIFIHILRARKKINNVVDNISWLKKYIMILEPFTLMSGIALFFTSAICFGFREEGSVGFLYIFVLMASVAMITILSLKKVEGHVVETSSTNRRNSLALKGIIRKAVLSTATVFMCVTMVVQAPNNTTSASTIAGDYSSQNDGIGILQEVKQTTELNTNEEKQSVENTELTISDVTTVVENTIIEIRNTNVSTISNTTIQSVVTETTVTEYKETLDLTTMGTTLAETQVIETAEQIATTTTEAPKPVVVTTEAPRPPVVTTTEAPRPPVVATTEAPKPPVTTNASQANRDSTYENHFDDYYTPEQQNTKNYVLNTSTKKIHEPSCNHVLKIKPDNYSTTKNIAEALNNGYVPCKNCEPR